MADDAGGAIGVGGGAADHPHGASGAADEAGAGAQVSGLGRVLHLSPSLCVCTVSLTVQIGERNPSRREGPPPPGDGVAGRSVGQARTLSSAFMICRSEASTPPMAARSMLR